MVTPSSYSVLVAENVQVAMLSAGFSQASLAETTGIPRVTLIRRLQGVTAFTVAELDAIAKALSIDVHALAVTTETGAA